MKLLLLLKIRKHGSSSSYKSVEEEESNNGSGLERSGSCKRERRERERERGERGGQFAATATNEEPATKTQDQNTRPTTSQFPALGKNRQKLVFGLFLIWGGGGLFVCLCFRNLVLGFPLSD